VINANDTVLKLEILSKNMKMNVKRSDVSLVDDENTGDGYTFDMNAGAGTGGGDEGGWGNEGGAPAAYQPQENAAWGSEPAPISAEPVGDWGGSNW
jgi:hypothetical protein